MTRIALISDSHFDQNSRFAECIRVHDSIVDDIAERGIDLILHGGDLYEKASTPAERWAAARFIQRCADIAPVVIVRGNHDQVGDLALLSRLTARHSIVVEEGAAVHHVAAAAVACLSWPRKAELLARAGAIGLEQSETMARDAMRDLLAGFGRELSKHEGPRILLAHAMVSGSKTSVGQPLVGCDLEIGTDDLWLSRADLIALGHIHKPQSWGSMIGGPIVYPGSPRRTSFGEVEDKGYVYATIGEGGACYVERIVIPTTPMVLLEASFAGGVLTFTGEVTPDDVAGAEIRIRYSYDADEREAASAAVDSWRRTFMEAGAKLVKVDPRVTTRTRARAPEVTHAKTIGAKLRTVWKARADEPDEVRAARLVAMAEDLEREVSYAS